MTEYKVNLSRKDTRRLQRLVASGKFDFTDFFSKAIDNYFSVLEQIELAYPNIDLFPADNGNNRTQKNWISFFNRRKKRMITTGDLLLAGQSGSDELLESLLKDFSESKVISSVCNLFDKYDLSAKVIHNFGSKLIKPIMIYVPTVPVLSGESAIRVVEGKGLDYAIAVFCPGAKPTKKLKTKMLDGLSRLSGKSPEDISFYTPDKCLRKKFPRGDVSLYYYYGKFYIRGSSTLSIVDIVIEGYPYHSGRSRGCQ